MSFTATKCSHRNKVSQAFDRRSKKDYIVCVAKVINESTSDVTANPASYQLGIQVIDNLRTVLLTVGVKVSWINYFSSKRS